MIVDVLGHAFDHRSLVVIGPDFYGSNREPRIQVLFQGGLMTFDLSDDPRFVLRETEEGYALACRLILMVRGYLVDLLRMRDAGRDTLLYRKTRFESEFEEALEG